MMSFPHKYNIIITQTSHQSFNGYFAKINKVIKQENSRHSAGEGMKVKRAAAWLSALNGSPGKAHRFDRSPSADNPLNPTQ